MVGRKTWISFGTIIAACLILKLLGVLGADDAFWIVIGAIVGTFVGAIIDMFKGG